MAFVRHPGVEGKIFVPEGAPGALRKHACKDCFFCQFCSDDRCQSCLSSARMEADSRGCRCEPFIERKDSAE